MRIGFRNGRRATLGGILAALVLVADLRPWCRGSHGMKQLSTFGKGFTGAALAAACPGGTLGKAHTHTHTHTGGIVNAQTAASARAPPAARPAAH